MSFDASQQARGRELEHWLLIHSESSKPYCTYAMRRFCPAVLRCSPFGRAYIQIPFATKSPYSGIKSGRKMSGIIAVNMVDGSNVLYLASGTAEPLQALLYKADNKLV